MDGTLNDLLWQVAKPINDFRQREPHEGELPTGPPMTAEPKRLLPRLQNYLSLSAMRSVGLLMLQPCSAARSRRTSLAQLVHYYRLVCGLSEPIVFSQASGTLLPISDPLIRNCNATSFRRLNDTPNNRIRTSSDW